MQSQKAYQPCRFFIYERVSSSSRKHSCKKGNTQIIKTLVNICCDWLNKTQVAFPPSKYTSHFLSTHAISLTSTASYHLLFVLHQEAKGPSSTCHRDWHCTNTQLETLLTKSLLLKWTRQTAWSGKQAHRGEVTCPRAPAEPGAPSSCPVLLWWYAQLLPATSFSKQMNYLNFSFVFL